MNLSVTVFSDLSITRIFNGAQRTRGPQPQKKRLEITKNILLKMLAVVDTSSFNGLNIYAAFCVAFAGFLRAGELTWDQWNNDSPCTQISRGSVNFTSNGVILHLPMSKTDQFGKGTDLTLSYSYDIACPVKALHRLFIKYPQPPSSPLFARAVGPFNKRWFTEQISSSLFRAGVPNVSGYSGHSFRRGAANTV